MIHHKALLSFVLLCVGICEINAQVHLISATRMEVDSRYDSCSNVSMRKLMASYKTRLDKEISRPIGTCGQYMSASFPESLLSNFIADQLFAKAAELTSGSLDFSVINIGSLRAPLNPGIITVGDIYKIMPFENELVILELKGSDVKSLFNEIVREGGAGVSNVKVEISGFKMKSLLIGGGALDENKIYRVATMDYLAEGNSGMTAFLKAVRRINTGLKARNIYIEQIEKLTARGKTIDARLDGRIKVISNLISLL